MQLDSPGVDGLSISLAECNIRRAENRDIVIGNIRFPTAFVIRYTSANVGERANNRSGS